MGKQYTIGLIYSVNENWIAGTYYIENLVSALKTLPPPDQPLIKVYCYNEAEYKRLVDRTGYVHLQPELIEDVTGLGNRLINAMSYRLFNKHWAPGNTKRNVDLIFPNPTTYHFEPMNRKLFWIPDFQELHLPAFFSTKQIEERRASYHALVRNNSPIVFSSENARKDFKTLFPEHRNQLFVMPFAVVLPDLSKLRVEDLQQKYKLADKYFICSNQFWAHKNHQVVLSAVHYLKTQNIRAHVVFTGKSFDDRNPHYYSDLLKNVDEFGIADQVNFLGFIPRDEQLLLMQNSLAIIQPSAFEGWSTVVEDAKALNQNIIVSDIEVHREQLPAHPYFFQPTDFVCLANYIKEFSVVGAKPLLVKYDEHVRRFAVDFLNIAAAVISGYGQGEKN